MRSTTIVHVSGHIQISWYGPCPGYRPGLRRAAVGTLEVWLVLVFDVVRLSATPPREAFGPLRADDGIRTRDPHLGKVMRYQLRYVRTAQLHRATVGNSS